MMRRRSPRSSACRCRARPENTMCGTRSPSPMEPATDRPCGSSGTAILLAAHGERRQDATNEGVFRLAQGLARRGLASEVAAGFINGVPTISDALVNLAARRIIVYPLFVSSGYFTRD